MTLERIFCLYGSGELPYCVELCCLTVVQRSAHQFATARFQEVLVAIVPVWRLERRNTHRKSPQSSD